MSQILESKKVHKHHTENRHLYKIADYIKPEAVILPGLKIPILCRAPWVSTSEEEGIHTFTNRSKIEYDCSGRDLCGFGSKTL